ncbi:hypothetical protein BI081_gp228 [Mycobacterium phage Tonenili]|uniref:Uncharacterized protein n=1 Tax=Mycobacterium phage Tonenili TaxID=1891703 RepID=A0A1C9EHA8_9CAUD|nr:hypothetical protein BI081_gp228 [Mycobacterium phage Tonenili]AON96879.1 hypothetical protein SEA_TONENILI_132 [Mycobacterium phage Tonenili]
MTTPTAQRKSLRELRESTGTLFAKNNTRNKITCNTDKIRFELEPAGTDDSIRIVPKECLNEPGFQRLWMRGRISISDDEAMENEVILLMSGQVETKPKVYSTDKDGNQIEVDPQLTESAESRDIVFREHGDPAQERGYGIKSDNVCIWSGCGAPVLIAQKFLDQGEPPLCQDHSDRKGQVASTPQPDGTWTHQVISMQPVQKSDLPAGG